MGSSLHNYAREKTSFLDKIFFWSICDFALDRQKQEWAA